MPASPSSSPPFSPRLLVGLLTLRMAGAERIAYALVEAFHAEMEVEVAVLRHRGERPPALAGLETDLPIHGALALLFRRCDLLHTHLFLPGLLVRIRRIWDRRTPWVHTVHYADYEGVRAAALKRWLDHRWIFPEPDALVAVSGTVEAALTQHPNLILIPNAIPLDPVGGRRKEATEGPVLGTVAMLRPEKGLESLIRAARPLRSLLPGVRIRIAGEGPVRLSLEALIQAEGAEDIVELCGYLPDLDAFYGGLDLYLHPARSEAFGLSVLEAYRFGLPILTSDAGFLPELLGEGRFGKIVPQVGVRGEEDAAAASFPQRLAEGAAELYRERALWQERSREGLAHWQLALAPAEMEARYRWLLRGLLQPGVAMIAPIATQGGGGLQRQLELQTRALAARGHRIYLLQREDPRRALDPAFRRRWAHVRFLPTPGPRATPSPGSLAERLWGVRFLLSGARLLLRHRHRIGVLHAHQLYSPTLLGAMVKRWVGAYLVTKVTASGELGEVRALEGLPFLRLRRAALALVDRFLVLTPGMGGELQGLGIQHDRIRVLPNSVEIPESSVGYGMAGGEAGAPESPLRVLFTGRLSTEKSLETLLAAAALGGWSVGIEIRLVGPGEPRRDAEPELRRLAAALPPGCTVHFEGQVAEVEPFLRKTDLFVLPSRSEGMSNALLEAMAIGLPCLASNIEPNRALIDDGVHGLLFPPGDVEALHRLLLRMDADRREGSPLAQRLGEAARQRIVEGYSPKAIAEQLERVYRGEV